MNGPEHTTESDASAYSREDLARAWEDGARAGHHSPLTWFALRKCNPHTRVTPSERGTPVTTECGAPRPTQDEVCGFALGRGRYCLGHPRFPMTHATMCPRFHAVTPPAVGGAS